MGQNQYLDFLINPSFQGVIDFNKLFVLSFENKNGRRSYSEYYFPKVEIKDDGRNFFLVNQEITILKHIKMLKNCYWSKR